MLLAKLKDLKDQLQRRKTLINSPGKSPNRRLSIQPQLRDSPKIFDASDDRVSPISTTEFESQDFSSNCCEDNGDCQDFFITELTKQLEEVQRQHEKSQQQIQWMSQKIAQIMHIPVTEVSSILFEDSSISQKGKFHSIIPTGYNVCSNKQSDEKFLFEAVYSNDLTSLFSMLQLNPRLLKARQESNGYTALHIAFKNNQLEVAKCLFHFNADVNSRASDGCTCLHLATTEDAINFLLQEGADPNVLNYEGLSSLAHFIYTRNLKAATLLLLSGADPAKGLVDKENNILRYCCKTGSYQSLSTIVFAAKVPIDFDQRDPDGNTLLQTVLQSFNQVSAYIFIDYVL